MNTRVLIAAADANALQPALATRFPEIDFHSISNPAALSESLRHLLPNIVFSIKSDEFSGPGHQLFAETPSVRWIQVGGSGFEHLGSWDTGRVTVTNCAGVLARHLAETVTGAMIALNGKFLTYLQQQSSRTWRPHTFRPLSEQTLLIVGAGEIGGRVADNAKALGMQTIGVRRRDVARKSIDQMITPDQLTGRIGEADVVSLHVRLDDRTRGMFDAAMLAAMKPGALLINTSRGAVVDQAALIESLVSGHLGGAYLDVFEVEPLPPTSPLWSLANVMITPHAADLAVGWTQTFARFFGDNLERWMSNRPLKNVVDHPSD
jgi:phosphoglycerate dehydrogenase-like enzyme